MDDEIGGEVSRKIKAAIKAKLVELGAYVDDELPDYIMIMVANKRSKSQMDSDLALFLNNNTKTFTSWLHTVLEKLQQVTVAAIDKKTDGKKAKKRESSTESKSSNTSGKKGKRKKKRKDKKQKKKHKKQKVKDDVKEDEKSAKKKSKKEKPDFIAKELGRAIIGSLKEKHKTDENAAGDKSRDCVAEQKLETTEQKSEELPSISTQQKIVPCEKLDSDTVESRKPEPVVDALESSEDLTVVAVKLNNARRPDATAVMAPTRELMKEHDKLTDTAGAKNDQSDDSLETAEELRRQLLLSRTQQKLQERNIASRMRSNSPEVVFVDDSILVQASELTLDKSKAASDSSKLSLRPSTLGSASVLSQRNSPITQQVSKKQITSLIVKRAEPEQPEIPSVVQFKPREFMPAEKQANKKLILQAVAAAERSIAKIATITKPTRELFTRELREKRYEKLSVTVDQTADKHSNPGQEETFISSKPLTKDKTESFIKGWLEDVEEAGRQEPLIIPDDLDEAITENSVNDSQIVVTVDGLSSDHEDESGPISHNNRVNCISDRFAKLSKPLKNHELKTEYEEFLRGRNRKRPADGESSNQRLLAELSMRFGKVNEKITRKRSIENERSATLRISGRPSKLFKHN